MRMILALVLLTMSFPAAGAGVRVPIGADCAVVWNPNAPSDQVDRYRMELLARPDGEPVQTYQTPGAETEASCANLGVDTSRAGQHYVRGFAHNAQGWSGPSEVLAFEIGEVLPVALMFSSTAELTDPQLLDGASIAAETPVLHGSLREPEDTREVSQVSFRCCDAQNWTHENVEQYTPFQCAVDLTQLAPGPGKQLLADVVYANGDQETVSAEFTLGAVTLPGPTPPGGVRLRVILNTTIEMVQ